MKAERPILDHQLLFEARRLIDGANVHLMKEMIFAYEQAIDLYNPTGHRRYHREHETRLRSYVNELRVAKLDRKGTRAKRAA